MSPLSWRTEQLSPEVTHTLVSQLTVPLGAVNPKHIHTSRGTKMATSPAVEIEPF